MARRLFQFRLRTLLAIMIALAIVFVLAGYSYRYRMSQVAVVPVPVTGIVTIDGQPAAGWRVTFQYTAFDKQGEDAFGVTDAGGRFAIAVPKLTPPGVWPGEYAVGVAPPPLDFFSVSQTWREHRYPRKYTAPEYSGLTATVTRSGANAFRFDLTGEPE